MRKALYLLCVIIFICSLTGFTSSISKNIQPKVVLKDGQLQVELKSNGDVLISSFYTRKNFEDAYFIISEGDSDKEIISQLSDMNSDCKVLDFHKTKDNISFKLLYQGDQAEFMYPHVTSKQLGEKMLKYLNKDPLNNINIQNFYKTYADEQKFIYFKDGKKLNKNDIAKYTNEYEFTITGFNGGAYYNVPSEILLVSGNLKYKKIDSNTVFINGSQEGTIIVKKYSVK